MSHTMRTTRGYHALALDFALAFEDDELASYWEWLLDGFPEPERTDARYDIARGRDGAFHMTRDGEEVLQALTAGSLAESFVQWLNQQATDPDYAVMSHAGAIARGVDACVLPADPESGKTTLTAGLVRAGFDYVTDEAVSFDLTTRAIEPYPKPLSMDPGSHFLFPELVPPTPPGDEPRPGAQWQIPPYAIRPDSVASSCRARWIVFPKYERGVETRLEPMARAEGLVELAKNTFRFRERPRRSLDLLGNVVRQVDCYRLAVGELDAACELVAELMEGG